MSAQPELPRRADVVVVGAGHNGLVAACYLAKAGLRVLVLEASPVVGGMTATNPIFPESPGHMINEGSIQASIFRATPIESELGLTRYGLRQIEMDPAFVQLGPDGSSLGLWHDAERTAAEIRRYSASDARAWLELSRTCDAVMDLVTPYINMHPTRPGIRGALSLVARAGRHPRLMADFGRLCLASMAEVVDEHFTTPLVRGFAAALALEPMTQPGSAMDLLWLGLHQRLGSSMFKGGTGALPKALQACLVDHGGSVRTSARVMELTRTPAGGIGGVRLESGQEVTARAVVTALSPKRVLNSMLPDGLLSDGLVTRAAHIPTTSTYAGDLKVDLALRGRVRPARHQELRDDGLDLRKPVAIWHTFEDHMSAWDAVVRRRWPERIPTLALPPTATDTSQGPDGQDTFWVWSGIVPAEPETPWQTVRDRIGDQVVADCGSYYEGITELEITRSVRSTPDIEERFNAIDGAVYHCDSILERMGPLRPAAGLSGYETPIPGLFLSGAGTHPGGGISGGSGRLAALRVIKRLRA